MGEEFGAGVIRIKGNSPDDAGPVGRVPHAVKPKQSNRKKRRPDGLMLFPTTGFAIDLDRWCYSESLSPCREAEFALMARWGIQSR